MPLVHHATGSTDTVLGCIHIDTSTSTSMCPGFRLWPEWSIHGDLYKHTTKRVSAILNKIESMKCFAIKTTIFHYKVTIFTNRTSLTTNSFTITSVLMSNVCHGF